jgi:RsiW-degrading membrane proteinase PrsW (M82 family)
MTMAQLLIAPVVTIPIAGLLWYNSRQEVPEDRVPTSFLLKTWALSGVFGPTIAGPVQLALGWPAGKLVFGAKLDQYLLEMGRTENEIKILDPQALAARREMAFSLPNLAGNLFLSTVAPLVEEILKYAVLKIVERYFPEKARTRRNYVLIAMATGLGFALVENLAFILSAMRSETSTQLAVTIIERGIAGTSGHLLTSALTACKFAESQASKGPKRSMWATIKESLLYHGLGNFSLFAISTLYGNVGWIHPKTPTGIATMVTCIASVNIVAAWRVRQELEKLDSQPVHKDL